MGSSVRCSGRAGPVPFPVVGLVSGRGRMLVGGTTSSLSRGLTGANGDGGGEECEECAGRCPCWVPTACWYLD